MLMANELNTYEQKVDQVVRQLSDIRKDRMVFFSGSNGANGQYWELAPKDTWAAKAYVYSVSASGINLTVADYYWINIPASPGNWNDCLTTLSAYLQAIIDGRIDGWYLNEYGAPTYVLEFSFGPDDDPVRYTHNVTFASAFKNRENVIHVKYQPY